MSAAAGKRHQSGRNPRQILMASLLDKLNAESEERLDIEKLRAVDDEQKFELIVNAVEAVNAKFLTVHSMVNDASDGLDPRTGDCEERVLKLTDENKQLRFELDMLKGLFIKMEMENTNLRRKVTTLTAKSMSSNILITGLCGDETTENPTEVVIEFLEEKLDLDFSHDSIKTARRIGNFSLKPEFPRTMMIQVNESLMDLIMSNKKKLRGKKNMHKKEYRISRQLPDEWNEENRQLYSQVTKTKKQNDDKTDDQEKDEIVVRRRTLYVNKVPQKKIHLQAPTAAEIFVDKTEQDKMDKIKFCASTGIEENGSQFTAFAIKLQSLTETKRAYTRLRQLHSSAAHIVAAYSFKNWDGFQDDREFGEGHRLLRILTDNQHNNVAIFVVRYHNGPNLGPRRHILYAKAAHEALARIKNKQ